jgi:hypothetical protein
MTRARWVAGLLAGVALVLASGCGGDDKKPPAGGPEVDWQDADAVAKAFVQALADRSSDVFDFIHESHREELKGEFLRSWPQMPEGATVGVNVTESGGTKTGRFTGSAAAVVGRLKMVYDDGRWWVTD